MPRYAKLFAMAVVAYALSPIDLIPDFVPVLGYADDLIVVPLGVLAVMKMTPPGLLAECRAQADSRMPHSPLLGWAGATMVIAVWMASALAFIAIVLA